MRKRLNLLESDKRSFAKYVDNNVDVLNSIKTKRQLLGFVEEARKIPGISDKYINKKIFQIERERNFNKAHNTIYNAWLFAANLGTIKL